MILRLNSRNNDSYLSKNNTVFDSIDSEKLGRESILQKVNLDIKII